jgi:DNA repair protein RadA/Sms
MGTIKKWWKKLKEFLKQHRRKIFAAVIMVTVVCVGILVYKRLVLYRNPAGVTNHTVNLGDALAKTAKGIPPDVPRVSTGSDKFDKLLGGHPHSKIGYGLPQGTMTIIAGEPGAGKSTLSDQLALQFADRGMKTSVISSEETITQMLTRFRRLIRDRFTANQKKLINLTATSDVTALRNRLAREKPDAIILDSLQGFEDVKSGSKKGSLLNMQQVAGVVSDYIKQHKPNGVAIVISQIIKNGAIAGPKSLQHLGDLILYVTGTGRYRILDPFKNRYNATVEKLKIEMTSQGLKFLNAM